MNRKLMLDLSAFFIFFTFVGHSIGIVLPIPPEQVEALRVFEQMKLALVPFPFGTPKSWATILTGANICVSVYLFVAGMLMVFLARPKGTQPDPRILVLNTLGVLVTSILSFIYFFPLPGIMLGIAGVLGFVALRR